MYTISKYKITVALIFSMFFYLNNVSAQECHEKSPNLVENDDVYYDLDPGVILSASDKEKLNDLFEAIVEEWRGDWEGKSVEIECKEHDDELVKGIKNSKITTNFKIDTKDNLIVKAEAYYPKEKKIKLKTLKLLDDLNIFGLKFINKNHVEFSTKYRRSVYKHKHLIETIYEIKQTKTSLLIQRKYYTSGIYTGEEIWLLGEDKTE